MCWLGSVLGVPHAPWRGLGRLDLLLFHGLGRVVPVVHLELLEGEEERLHVHTPPGLLHQILRLPHGLTKTLGLLTVPTQEEETLLNLPHDTSLFGVDVSQRPLAGVERLGPLLLHDGVHGVHGVLLHDVALQQAVATQTYLAPPAPELPRTAVVRAHSVLQRRTTASWCAAGQVILLIAVAVATVIVAVVVAMVVVPVFVVVSVTVLLHCVYLS